MRQKYLDYIYAKFGVFKSNICDLAFVKFALLLIYLFIKSNIRYITSLFQGVKMAAKDNILYSVTITGWKEHQPKHRKNYNKFLFYSGFFSDHKISCLSKVDTLFYIYLLCVACERSHDTITISTRQIPRQLTMRTQSMLDALAALERLQLVTVQKEPLIEVNRIKLNETKLNRIKVPSGVQKTKVDSSETWEKYSLAYRGRYGADPVRNATTNSQIVNLIKRLGASDAPLVASFFVSLNDPWYVKQGHSVGVLLRDCEKIRTLWATGRRSLQVDKDTLHVAEQYKKIQAGEL